MFPRMFDGPVRESLLPSWLRRCSGRNLILGLPPPCAEIIIPFHAVMILSSSPGANAFCARRIEHRLESREDLLQFVGGEPQFVGNRLDGLWGCAAHFVFPIAGRRYIVIGAEPAGILIVCRPARTSSGVQTKNFPSTPSESASVAE